MLHKYNGAAYDSCGQMNGVWSKCGDRVQPWEAKYQWEDVTCEACRAHPDCGISLAKKRKSPKVNNDGPAGSSF